MQSFLFTLVVVWRGDCGWAENEGSIHLYPFAVFLLRVTLRNVIHMFMFKTAWKSVAIHF